MNADFQPVWGRLDTSRTALLAVRTDADGFTVSATSHDENTVTADEFVSVVRAVETSRSTPGLRIDHTAAGVPSPATLFLGWDDPVRHAIERLRPDLLTTEPAPLRWKAGMAAIFVVGLALVVAGLVLL